MENQEREDLKDFEQKVEDELRHLNSSQKQLQTKLSSLDQEIEVNEQSLSGQRARLQAVLREKEEMGLIWNKLKKDFSTLKNKRDQYKRTLENHKMKMEEANKIKELESERAGQFSHQKTQAEKQHQQKLKYITDEHSRKKELEKAKFENEIAVKENMLDNLKTRLTLLSNKELEGQQRIAQLIKDREMYSEIEQNDQQTQVQIETLERELEEANAVLAAKEDFARTLQGNQDEYPSLMARTRAMTSELNQYESQKRKLALEVTDLQRSLKSKQDRIQDQQRTNQREIDHQANHSQNNEQKVISQIQVVDSSIRQKQEELRDLLLRFEASEKDSKKKIYEEEAYYQEMMREQELEVEQLKAKLRSLGGMGFQ